MPVVAACRALVASLLLIGPAAPALAASMTMPEARTALLLAGGPPGADGYVAGIAIDLPAGWHTYWSNPGDAGIPPVIDTAASANVAAVAVGYPAPRRYSDGVSTSMIYEGRVVLPLRIKPRDPDDPVNLRVELSYGLCAEICLPASASLTARLDPRSRPDAAAAGEIAAFQAKVPRLEAAGDRLAVRAVAFDATKRTGTLTIAARDGGDLVDLFATIASPWYAGPPMARGHDGDRTLFDVAVEAPRGATSLAGLPLTLTWIGRKDAYDIPLHLD